MKKLFAPGCTLKAYTLPDVVDYFIDFYEDQKLTGEDWLHIADACDKRLEKYYERFKK